MGFAIIKKSALYNPDLRNNLEILWSDIKFMNELNIQICKNCLLKKGTDIVASTQMLQIIKALDQKLKGMENTDL